MNRSIELQRTQLCTSSVFSHLYLFTAPASAESIYPSIGLAVLSLLEILLLADFDFQLQPNNDMATYAVPASSITVNMHIPENDIG